MQNVQYPPKPPLDEEFWLHDAFSRRPNVAFIRKHFYKEGRLQEHQALWILEEGRNLMKEEPNVLAVEAPVTSIKYLHLCSASCRFDDTLPRSRRKYSWSICALSNTSLTCRYTQTDVVRPYDTHETGDWR